MNRYMELLPIVAIIIIMAIIYFIVRKPYVPSPLILKLKYKLALINRKFYDYDIREGSSSYTENKSTIYVCTRDPQTGEYYGDNTLIYVCLHECAHVLSQDYGHHNEFNNILNQLVKKAMLVGIYNPSIPIPKTYCSIQH